MAIVEVKEQAAQRAAEKNAQTVGTSTRCWGVVTDDKHDDELVVFAAAGIPDIRDAHPTRSGLYCDKVTARQADGNNGKCWEIIATYSGIDPQKNPWDRAPIWSGGFQTYELPVDQLDPERGMMLDPDTSDVVPEASEDWTLVRNSAGDPFDPPLTEEVSMPLATVRVLKQHFSTVDSFMRLQDCINEDEFLGWPKYAVKVTGVTFDEQSEIVDGSEVNYWGITISFAFNRTKYGWRRRILDAGFRELDDDDNPVHITLDGREPTQPVPLNGEGKKLDFEEDEVPVWFTWITKPVDDFSVLDLSAPT